MVCHSCHGQHWVLRGGQMMPCPECGGLGEVHCCDGLVAQQDAEGEQKHDFGAFDADGHRIFFKIDYYDKTLTYHSPDPSDPSVTERVITIMLAEEY